MDRDRTDRRRPRPDARVTSELPPGWSVRTEVVRFGTSDVAEALVFERSRADTQLYLTPAAVTEPSRDVEWYERAHPTAAREHVRTVATLDEAVRAAVDRVHQLDG